MKRSDFKEIKEIFFETCKENIQLKGTCQFIDCDNCPFYEVYGEKNACYASESDEELVDKCWEFLDLEEE